MQGVSDKTEPIVTPNNLNENISDFHKALNFKLQTSAFHWTFDSHSSLLFSLSQVLDEVLYPLKNKMQHSVIVSPRMSGDTLV